MTYIFLYLVIIATLNFYLCCRIGGVMVSVLASGVVDRGFESGLVKPKTIKVVFVASPLSTQQ